MADEETKDWRKKYWTELHPREATPYTEGLAITQGPTLAELLKCYTDGPPTWPQFMVAPNTQHEEVSYPMLAVLVSLGVPDLRTGMCRIELFDPVGNEFWNFRFQGEFNPSTGQGRLARTRVSKPNLPVGPAD